MILFINILKFTYFENVTQYEIVDKFFSLLQIAEIVA